ncbi:hypothetical protein OQH61_03195 [Helicobacter sp. MIT 21-1697]|uniref:hypothetical protein n=1 Tax=Helicobacter sp. MIT 21-1697 TaxID=2993733 RepID=UPI00224A71FC|nr:hypothetical protein [Helicobacter sp. MIT 21-1697]MCX2716738.1 hypothetical protein [Helicobacter sp. MIT 21-1697]
MKKIVVSSALSALLVLPAAAFEVYNADDKKLDVYGSIRGFVGMGENTHKDTSTRNAAPFLFGVQNNSNFGVKFHADKFSAQVEIGAVESDPSLTTVSPLRLFWGSYDTGMGTILIGKAQTPTADTSFSNDLWNNDMGSWGFGGVATSDRKLQAQYSVAGLSLALVNDYLASGYGVSNEMPRIAVSYSVGDKANPVFKIAGAYKHYNPTAMTRGSLNAGNLDNNTGSNDAWHIFVGAKPTFGSSWLSLVAHYGKNAHIYGNQGTATNVGGWAHSSVSDGLTALTEGISIKRSGGKVEFGTALSKELSFIVGAGYQETFGNGTAGKFKGYTAFVQLPYKVSANLTLSPQVGWYQQDNVATANKPLTREPIASVNGAVRVKWDF